MSFLLKSDIHHALVDTLYNEFLSRRSNYYYFIGRVIEWENEIVPPTPEDRSSYEYATRNDILSVKRINLRDASLVARRINWASGTVYDYFDENYGEDYPAFSGATRIEEANFYVLTSTFNVYKCLFNNNNAQSIYEPSGTDPTTITTNDGYIWKYLYTIPLSSRNRFLTQEYMPVQKSTTNAYYSNGEISSIVIDSAGSGYFGNAEVTLTVVGEFLGKPGNAIANLRPVLNASGEFIDVIIDNPGNNYKTASVVITDNFGSGTSFFKGLSNIKIFNPGANYYPNVVANTTVVIATTGNIQPTANAFANLVFSSNCLVDIEITNKGSGYTSAVIANTTIAVSTSGSVQPTSNASANLFFANSAILTPALYNGQIEHVIINDHGTGYSSNIQTIVQVVGDGTGAVLTPYINSSGQLEDIIIEERGGGYTSVDLRVVGNGTNANAYVNLSLNDLDTLQTVVELSAIDGALYAFRIADPGNNYSHANIVVSGDGTGFGGNVVLDNNTVSYITVTTPGYGYTYANVSIVGDGANANVIPIYSPFGGHGFDAPAELYADAIMFTSTINNDKNQGVEINNDYRQFGVIKDLRQHNSTKLFSNISGSACFLVTLDSVSGIANDDELYIDVGSSRKVYVAVQVLPNTSQVLLKDIKNHDLVATDVITHAGTAVPYTVVSIDKSPDINKFSGKILYIDNRTSVSHSEEQLVTLRTIIKL